MIGSFSKRDAAWQENKTHGYYTAREPRHWPTEATIIARTAAALPANTMPAPALLSEGVSPAFFLSLILSSNVSACDKILPHFFMFASASFERAAILTVGCVRDEVAWLASGGWNAESGAASSSAESATTGRFMRIGGRDLASAERRFGHFNLAQDYTSPTTLMAFCSSSGRLSSLASMRIDGASPVSSALARCFATLPRPR